MGSQEYNEMQAAGKNSRAAVKTSRVTALDKRLARHLLETLGNPPIPFVLWNGEEVAASRGDAVARLHFHDRKALWQLPLNPNLNFGDAYTAGKIEVEGDILQCMEALFHSMPSDPANGVLGRAMRLLSSMRTNTLGRSRENIHRHYDLGNDFYKLWLDEELVYTCAYYTQPTDTLESAQLAKMDHVCRKLRLKPGDEVVEAGCGWGSLARHMARHYGVKVRAYNISHEQIRYAQERAKAEGLDDRVEYIEDDFRNITGEYDVFASVGMLEHVGSKNYGKLGEVIDRSLKENGRGLIHSVGRNCKFAMGDWIERRIFPGSYVPCLHEMLDIFEPFEFSVLDVENLRLHYARTLRDWLINFERVEGQVENMYDASFVRAWRLYLAGCSASFGTGWLQLFQVLFNRERNNDISWTRAHLYHD
jgi:cyclopropane-fatty-acyl-phospholipid synthase